MSYKPCFKISAKPVCNYKHFEKFGIYVNKEINELTRPIAFSVRINYTVPGGSVVRLLTCAEIETLKAP